MSDNFLPPVVTTLVWEDESALAQMKAYRDSLAELAAESDATTSSMSKGAKGASQDMRNLAADGKGALEGDLAGSMGAVGAKADETAGRVHDSAGKMRGDLENIGSGALAGSGATKAAMEDASKGVGAAEKDIESKSSGFSSRIAGAFKSAGSSMGNFGIPFAGSVSKMGEKIDEAERKGSGFKASLESIGKTATIVGGVALAGVAAESVKMADEFDVANVQLQNAIKNTTGSFPGLQSQINATYSKMAGLGFNSTETAKALQSLTIATKSPTTAIRDMAVASDLARAKNMSLEGATQTLTKVYAGSQRALTQLGLNLDVGTGKLKSIQSATESVTTAHRAVKIAQEEASEATGTKAPAAARKLETAQLKLAQAEHKLQMDQHATGDILAAVAQRTHGAASAFGSTLAGQVDKAKATIHNLATEFGEVLIPIIAKAAGVLASIISFFMHSEKAAIALAVVIGGPLVASITVYLASLVRAAAANVATVAGWIWSAATAVASAAAQVGAWVAVGAAATAAFIAENVATLGIVAGIAAVVAAAVYLATHWTQVWDTIKQIVATAVEWVKSHLTLVMVALTVLLGPIGLLIDAFILLSTKWKQITGDIASFTSNMVGAVVHFFSQLPGEIWNAIVSIPGDVAKLWQAIEKGVPILLSNIVHFFSTLPGKVVAAVEALPGDMLKLGEEIMQAIIHGVEKLASAFASTIKKTILGPVEAAVSAVEGLFGGGGGGGKPGQKEYRQAGGGSVEREIIETARAHGLSASAAAGMVGNAAQESGLNPGEAGGGLYQMSGYPGSDSAGSAAQQTVKAIELMGASLVAQLNKASSPAQAANMMMKYWEKPEGSQPGETSPAAIRNANAPHREQVAEEAAKHIKGAIETTPPTTAAAGLSKAIGGTTAKEAQKAIEKTKAEGVKKAIETAKLDLTEAKKTFSSAFGEMAKLAEKVYATMIPKGGGKAGELKRLEEGHEVSGNVNAVAEAEASLRTAEGGKAIEAAQSALDAARRKQSEAESKQGEDEGKLTEAQQKLATAEKERSRGKGTAGGVESAKSGVASAESTLETARGSAISSREAVKKAEEETVTAATGRAAEIKAAKEALDNALYAQKTAALKKEAAAEEASLAREKALKTAAFANALAQLKTHLEHGKTSTAKGMQEIQKVLHEYGLNFGKEGKRAGIAWVRQFEEALEHAASGAGAITARITADIKAGLHIPGLAAGGIVTSPTLAVIGESGPEAVVPLSGLSTAQPGALPLGGAAGGKQIIINSQVYTNATTSAQTVNEQYQALRPLLLQAAG